MSRSVQEAARPGGFVAYIQVRHHELDSLGHVNNAVYLHYLEQTAIAHSAFLGYDTQRLRALGGLFVARRHEIDYLRPAFAGEYLRVLTWVETMSGARAIRNYAIERIMPPADRRLPADDLLPAGFALPSAPLVQAQTVWVWVDPEQGRPRRIPAELIDAFLSLSPVP